MHRERPWRTNRIAATCVLLIVAVFAGCRGTERQEVRLQPHPPQKSIKRIPKLVGMNYERAKRNFLQAGGAVVRPKPKLSAEVPGTVIAQQPPPGERFSHAIELVIARPQKGDE